MEILQVALYFYPTKVMVSVKTEILLTVWFMGRGLLYCHAIWLSCSPVIVFDWWHVFWCTIYTWTFLL